MSDLVEYVFLTTNDKKTKDWMMKHYKKDFQTSDGSPDCNIDEGWLLPISTYELIPTYDGFDFKLDVYSLSDRFESKEDFLTQFWDGDVEDDDFIEEDLYE